MKPRLPGRPLRQKKTTNFQSPTSQISVNNRVQPDGKTKNKSRSAQQLQRQPEQRPRPQQKLQMIETEEKKAEGETLYHCTFCKGKAHTAEAFSKHLENKSKDGNNHI